MDCCPGQQDDLFRRPRQSGGPGTRPEIGIVTTRSFLTNEANETVMDMKTTFMVKRGAKA